ncbi:MAG: transcription antitermination factor NusB, partial [Desulfobacca sp.]|nr:transcription antitermination factor NusB [Desulfobacca sp.]
QWEMARPVGQSIPDQYQQHFQAGQKAPAYFRQLVEGVQAHQAELDALITRFAEHWRLERMTVIDRNLLRLATFELLYVPQVPPKAAINEAVELAKRYGTEDSAAFINGILDRIWKAR